MNVENDGDVALIKVSGLIDEKFSGFGVGAAKSVVIDVSDMTRMTSFGVRQWLKAMDGLPKSITDAYLLACPTFFVYQLNMVLNFGGSAKVLSVVAPYTCMSCGVESSEMIDVLANRSVLMQHQVPERDCIRCGGKLELDETPESYFAFVSKYGASALQPAAAQALGARNLYVAQATTESEVEKPPKIIKLVHGSVTYFRISGTIGSMFRARPFLVGAEGEVVIDLSEVDRFDLAAHKEWRRLLRSLSGQVPAVTLVDVGESLLAGAGDTLALAPNISVATIMLPYGCIECFRISQESVRATRPLQLSSLVCSACGGATGNKSSEDVFVSLEKANTSVPPESAKVIAQRAEILSRALIDASVAQAGDRASPAIAAEDTILGKYKIVRRLSVGGMAEVFVAKQVGIGGFEKPVALKRIQRKLLDNRQQAVELFLNEAKIAGRLIHPNIVQVLDVGEGDGALFIAMEYVHGKDLNEIVKKLRAGNVNMPLAQALFVVREIAQALHHAYWSVDMTGKRLSVVHRDISPANIIISYDGTVKLLDFGVAMSSVTDHAKKIVVGKWLFMSPEATGDKQLDHRSDLFSLGVVLYLLCSGQLPFTGRDPKEIAKKMRASQYKPLDELVAVPDELSQLVSRLLAPNPDDRPQRGQDVVSELAEIARRHKLDASGGQLAELVNQLFGDEARASAEPTPIAVNEVMMSDGQTTGPITKTGPVMKTGSIVKQASNTAPRPVANTGSMRPLADKKWLVAIVIAILIVIALFLLVRPQ